MRFSTILCSHENSPPSVLSWLASFDDNRLLERISEHPNTPEDTLQRLATHAHPCVRAALADNPKLNFELLFALARDEHPDVRFRLAENYNLPQEILAILCEDENPFVAHRAQESARSLHRRPPIDTIASHKMTVLIVDDDDVARLILSISLKTDPLVQLVGQASSGEDGVRQAIEHQPDIVLMDIGMPGMNGIKATAEIKQMVPHSKVIMVTAHESLGDIAAAIKGGADGYHLKSTPNHDLGKAIRVVAGGAYWLDPGLASMVLRDFARRAGSASQKMSSNSCDFDETATLSNPVETLMLIADEYQGNDLILEARQICQSALSLSQSFYGNDAAITKKTMSRLAELYFLEEQFSASESTYLKLIEMQSGLYNLETPDLESHLSILAEFYTFRKDYEQATLFYSWLQRIHTRDGGCQNTPLEWD